MSQKREIKLRRCTQCLAWYSTTATEIKHHAEQCDGKPTELSISNDAVEAARGSSAFSTNHQPEVEDGIS
jgi:hypothetical protein